MLILLIGPISSFALLTPKTDSSENGGGENRGLQAISLSAKSVLGEIKKQKKIHLCLLDQPFLTNEEVATLPVIEVRPSGKYTGTRLKSVIRTLRGLLDQGVPSKELEVSILC